MPGWPARQPMQGPFSFGQLRALSAAFYLTKLALVLALAWRAVRQS